MAIEYCMTSLFKFFSSRLHKRRRHYSLGKKRRKKKEFSHGIAQREWKSAHRILLSRYCTSHISSNAYGLQCNVCMHVCMYVCRVDDW